MHPTNEKILRLRPVLSRTGLAVPMLGGMVSSTLLTLIVIPAVYALVKTRKSTEAVHD